jgi:hypothetical protein
VTPEPPTTVFVTVANLDDQLGAARWVALHAELAQMIERAGGHFLGEWFSAPTAPWVTACWCIDIAPGVAERLKGELAAIGVSYGRGLIGWSEVASAAILG